MWVRCGYKLTFERIDACSKHLYNSEILFVSERDLYFDDEMPEYVNYQIHYYLHHINGILKLWYHVYVVNRSHRDSISVSRSLVHGEVTIQMRSSDIFKR